MRIRNGTLLLVGLFIVVLSACGDSSSGRADADGSDTPDASDTNDASDTPDPDTTAPDTAEPDTAEPDTAEDTREPDDLGDSETLDAPDARDDSADTSTETTTPPACPWEPWNQGLDGGRVDVALFDPRIAGVAWSFSGGVAFRSTDSGATWSEWATDIFANFLAFPPSDLKEVLIGGQGLSISRDTGRTFEPYALSGLRLSAVAVDPALPQRLWAAVIGIGLLRSDDAGRTFGPRNNGITNALIVSIAGFPDVPDTTLIGTVDLNEGGAPLGRGKILRTTNGGQTFSVVNSDISWGTDFAACASQPGLIYAAARSGARVSNDYGLTWSKVPVLEGLDVLDIALSSDCATLWVAAPGRGIYRMTDGGATLEGPMVTGLDLEWTRFFGTISVDPNDSNILLLSSHSGIFRSVDRGFSWHRIPAARGLSVTRMHWSAGADRMFLTSWGSGLWTRTSTTPWVRAPRPTMDFLITVGVANQDARRLVVGAQGLGWATTTGVTSLEPRIAASNVFDAYFFDNGDILAATQTNGLNRSSDGITWVSTNQGIAPWPTNLGNHLDTRSIAVSGDDPPRIYVGTRGRGVVVSEDGGLNWRFGDNALSQTFVLKVVVDALDQSTVYALTEDRGVFISNDGGDTFEPLGSNLESLLLNNLVQDPTTGTLYATPTQGAIQALIPGSSTWTVFRRFCADAENFSVLTIQEAADGRWLVGAKSGNRIIRTRLDDPEP